MSMESNNKTYYFDIMETQPNNVILTTDCDLRLDFAEPRDFAEWTDKKKKEQEEVQEIKRQQQLEIDYADFKQQHGYIPFQGKGYRLGP